jgi:hypothetical protein
MASREEVRKYVFFGALIVLFLAGRILKGSDWWLIHVRYSGADSVMLQPKPIDCDWATSPQGEKGCHYECYIFVAKEGDKITQVHRTWKRVEDNH